MPWETKTMNIIRIFIGSSINDLKKERMRIMSYTHQINQYFRQTQIPYKIKLEVCEFKDKVVEEKKSQFYINELAKESNLAIFLAKNIFGEYTEEEFLFALKNQKNSVYTKVEMYIWNQLPKHLKLRISELSRPYTDDLNTTTIEENKDFYRQFIIRISNEVQLTTHVTDRYALLGELKLKL
jgi:hypothetical protein